ncbi:MAG: PspA/IM30 family protein, partial [Anaerolineae bacterium]|nr:PspA/IM30 family protein [Anaerolineae bacterium]
IRQVEDSLEDLEDAAATVGGQVRTLRRKTEEYEARAAELDRNIDIFLQEGKEELAAATQSKLNSVNRSLAAYKEQYQRQQGEYQKLLDAKLKLEAKLATIKQEREELQILLDLARSKEITVRTIRSLDDLVGAGDSDVARIAESIRTRLDKASAEAEMLATRLDEQMDEVLERRQIEAQLMERKKRLGLE